MIGIHVYRNDYIELVKCNYNWSVNPI